MIRRQHIGQSALTVPAHIWNIDGRKIVRTLFDAGQWVATRVPQRCSYSQWESLHIHVNGRSHEIDGRLPDIGPGWMSRSDDFVMEAGDYKRVFDEPTEYWCCLWTEERGCADVSSVHVPAGQALALDTGSTLFVISGHFTVAGEPHAAPQLLKVKSQGLTLEATEDAFAFVWS